MENDYSNENDEICVHCGAPIEPEHDLMFPDYCIKCNEEIDSESESDNA